MSEATTQREISCRGGPWHGQRRTVQERTDALIVRDKKTGRYLGEYRPLPDHRGLWGWWIEAERKQ